MVRNLETHRFDISEASSETLHEARQVLEELQEQIPQTVGISFFGSRVLAKEKPDSDLDFYIFYDASGFDQIKKDELAIKIYKQLSSEISERMGVKSNNFAVDISLEATDADIQLFKSTVKRLSPDFKTEIDYSQIEHEALPFVARFFLGIGEKLYENRSYILQKFSEDPEGEKYFKIFMEYLQFVEREIREHPDYSNYPKNIEEARKFFITK